MRAAALGGDESLVAERIARLMRALETEVPQAGKRGFWLFAFAVGITLAVLLGTEFGERAVRVFLAVV